VTFLRVRLVERAKTMLEFFGFREPPHGNPARAGQRWQ